MFNWRLVSRAAGSVAVAAMLLLAGCGKNGLTSLDGLSKNGRMYDDVLVEPSEYPEAKPTYTIFGPFASGESPEIKGERIMKLACPNGDPQLLYADSVTSQNAGRGGSGPWFGAAFTCDHALW
ncbi:hypothetical protein [Dongia sp. agr-C8]